MMAIGQKTCTQNNMTVCSLFKGDILNWFKIQFIELYENNVAEQAVLHKF